MLADLRGQGLHPVFLGADGPEDFVFLGQREGGGVRTACVHTQDGGRHLGSKARKKGIEA